MIVVRARALCCILDALPPQPPTSWYCVFAVIFQACLNISEMAETYEGLQLSPRKRRNPPSPEADSITFTPKKLRQACVFICLIQEMYTDFMSTGDHPRPPLASRARTGQSQAIEISTCPLIYLDFLQSTLVFNMPYLMP
jgi:hypothetical protein